MIDLHHHTTKHDGSSESGLVPWLQATSARTAGSWPVPNRRIFLDYVLPAGETRFSNISSRLASCRGMAMPRCALLALAVLVAVSPAARPADADGRKVALVVGVKDYKDTGLPNLRYP